MTDTPKWTPGPWAFDNGCVEAFRGHDKDGAEYWEHIAEVENAVDGPLLALAQDMYLALERAIEWENRDAFYEERAVAPWFDVASELIAKARGQA